MYDLIIIGGGPAGSAAAVYAARKRLKTALITSEFGGQSVVSEDIQNWIGTVSISGSALAESFKKHVLAYADDVVEVKEGERVLSVKKDGAEFLVATDGGHEYKTKTVLIVTGSSRRKLTVPGAEQFENKGITYCASCDGPLFSGKDVAVIGGGNAAFETAAQLLAYTKSVTLLNRSDDFRADPVTVEKVRSHPKMKIIMNAALSEIKGENFVKMLTYKINDEGEPIELPTEGIFVEIGLVPATGFAKDLVELNKYGMIVIDPRTQATAVPGIWAAGDCTDVLYHQNNIAAGDAVRALEDIYIRLHTK
ncbi:MAG: FAD-dependent oxidoreductase [Parcubacteria group bacterium]|nr:FAD-dependent oxidoreductase [Parcubacteria group bacterium]